MIDRGNNRNEIFCADTDYQFYLEKLQLACDEHDCKIHAYVLMTNHVHLLITPHTEDGLSKVMQILGRYYVQYFNYTYQRTGTLWEGRYKATLIDSQAYLWLFHRYLLVLASPVGGAPSPRFTRRRNLHGIGPSTQRA